MFWSQAVTMRIIFMSKDDSVPPYLALRQSSTIKHYGAITTAFFGIMPICPEVKEINWDRMERKKPCLFAFHKWAGIFVFVLSDTKW